MAEAMGDDPALASGADAQRPARADGTVSIGLRLLSFGPLLILALLTAGVTLAIIRKVRMFFWIALGLIFLAMHQPQRDSAQRQRLTR